MRVFITYHVALALEVTVYSSPHITKSLTIHGRRVICSHAIKIKSNLHTVLKAAAHSALDLMSEGPEVGKKCHMDFD